MDSVSIFFFLSKIRATIPICKSRIRHVQPQGERENIETERWKVRKTARKIDVSPVQVGPELVAEHRHEDIPENHCRNPDGHAEGEEKS